MISVRLSGGRLGGLGVGGWWVVVLVSTNFCHCLALSFCSYTLGKLTNLIELSSFLIYADGLTNLCTLQINF